MVNTIFILNESFKATCVLTINGKNTFFDDLYSLDLSTCTESFEFSTNAEVDETNYVMFYYQNQYKLFTVIEIEQEHTEGKIITNVYAECTALELLNNAVRAFEGEYNCIAFFEYLLDGTGWQIGTYSSSLAEKVVTVKVDKTTQIWSCIQDYMADFGYEINTRVNYTNGHVKNKIIDIYAEGELGRKTYKRFEYGRNVEGITKKKDLYDFATALILDTNQEVTDVEYNNKGFVKEKGSDVVLAVNNNKTYNFGRNYIYGNFEDNDSQSGVEVVEKALAELKRRSVPCFDYECDTALTYAEYEDISIGDTVYVIDHTFNPIITLEARIGELEISFTDRNSCKCNLTNYKEIKSKISVELTGGIQDIIDAYFPITSDKLAPGSVDKDKINVETYDTIIADSVGASKVVCEELIAKEITAIEGRFENIEAEHGEFKDLTTENFEAVNARIENLDVGNLEAEVAKIRDLEADVAKIGLLIGNNASIDDIQSLILTSKNVTIENALIKDAMIETVNASKINAGVINTNTVKIQSEDGGISISDETMQFKDENDVVRIQIGRDTNNNFTFVLYDATGKGQLIDANGIKSSSAIADGLIRNDHIADSANISGGKIDMSSLFEEMNEDGSNTLKASKVYFDDKKQTLNVAFNNMTTKVDDNSSKLNTQSTQISVMQGNISSLITDTTITDDEGTTKLKDRYLLTEATVDGLTTKVNSLETTYESTLKSSKTMYYLSSSNTELKDGEWKEAVTQQAGKYIWLKIVYTYTDNSTSESTPVCIQGHDGNAVEGAVLYTWIRYADDDKGTNISNDPTGKAYIGFAYNQTTATESNRASDYTWSKIQGEKGDQGVPGEPGTTTYTWIKYSDNANGNPCYDTPKSTTQYIGIATNKTTATESSTYTDYTWSKFKGEQGIQGEQGATGDKGQSLVSSTPQYYLSTSNSTQSGGSWTETMPTMTAGRYMWSRFKLVWENPSATTYTTPQLDKICEVIKGVDEHLSEVEQTANKISWLVKSGTSSSNMVLTDNMYSLITENITLSADNIRLEGYFSANNNFSIDLSGNMTAKNGTFSGNITGSTFSSMDGGFQVDDAGEVRGTDISTSGTLTGWDIVASGSLTAPWYAPSLTRDVTVYIKSDYIYPVVGTEEDISFYHGAYFRNFADLLSVCPRNLNGYNLRVRFKSNLSELVEINGLNNGNLYIEMQGYTLNGYFQIKGHSLWAGVYGNTSGSTNTTTRGVIKPNTGYLYSNYRYAILAQTNKFYLYDVDIYKGKATDYSSNCISVSSGCRAYLNSIKAVNTPNCLLRCHASAHVYVASSSGTTSSTVFQAVSGSIIVVNDTTQAGRPSSVANQYFEDNNSKVFADGVTWDSVAQTGTNDNNDTSTTITKTVTIKSDTGYSWRTNGNYANSWSSDAIVRQGRWTTGYGMNVGYWFFDDDIYDILQNSDNTVTSVKIKITRASGGNSASRTHYLRCHTYAKKSSSSSPSLLGTSVLNKSFSLAVGSSITISLTSSEISALKSNKAKGFGLYTSDSTTGASGNYSCCSPTATVTITYKTTS